MFSSSKAKANESVGAVHYWNKVTGLRQKNCAKYVMLRLQYLKSRRLAVLSLLFAATVLTYIFAIRFTQPTKGFAGVKLKAEHEPRFRSPRQHVYFLRTHKTGSGTVCSILTDYIQSHHLLPLLPKRINFNQGNDLKTKQISLIEGVKKYDVVFSHHIFTQKMFPYLYSDTFLVTILREPFSNFVSAFFYYKKKWRVSYLVKVPGDDPVSEFLRDPQKYEAEGYKSYTNNRQSMDLGFDMAYKFDDAHYIKQFIKHIERQFDLVMIMEYFDEGLVMMKRILHWETKDILYFHKNKGQYNKTMTEAAQQKEIRQRELHSRFSKADTMLYEYFLDIFKRKMIKEVGLEEEVAEFRQALRKMWDFCDVTNNVEMKLVVPAGKWSNEFTIEKDKCEWQDLECYQITDILRKDYMKKFVKASP